MELPESKFLDTSNFVALYSFDNSSKEFRSPCHNAVLTFCAISLNLSSVTAVNIEFESSTNSFSG